MWLRLKINLFPTMLYVSPTLHHYPPFQYTTLVQSGPTPWMILYSREWSQCQPNCLPDPHGSQEPSENPQDLLDTCSRRTQSNRSFHSVEGMLQRIICPWWGTKFNAFPFKSHFVCPELKTRFSMWPLMCSGSLIQICHGSYELLDHSRPLAVGR